MHLVASAFKSFDARAFIGVQLLSPSSQSYTNYFSNAQLHRALGPYTTERDIENEKS